MAITLNGSGTVTGITDLSLSNVTASNNLTAANTVSGNNVVSSSAFSLRNRIINGDMRIDQRNNGAAQSLTQAYAFTVDRWWTYAFGSGTCTGQRVASGVTGVPYVYQITGGSGITALQFMQRIESSNIADLAGSTVTLSVLMSNSLLGIIAWTAYYPNSVDNYGTYTQIATGTFTVNSTLTRYSTQISLPANAANGLWIIFSTTAQTSGTWKIGDVQLEAGSVATPFEHRPYGMELAMCQRYFQKLSATLLAMGGMGNANGQGFYRVLTFPVQMRTAPTVTLGTPSLSNCTVSTVSVADGINTTAMFTPSSLTAWAASWNVDGTFSAEL